VLVLTNQYWRSRFGGDTKILGQTLRMNDRPITVIGVLPPLPQYPGKDDVYMPTSACPFRSSPMSLISRNLPVLNLFGSPRPGVALDKAAAALPQSSPTEGYVATRHSHEEDPVVAHGIDGQRLKLGKLRVTRMRVLPAAHFQRPAGTANLAELSVCLSKGRDGIPPITQPAV